MFYAPDRKTWREWLEKNHDKEKEVWLVYYRKSSGAKQGSETGHKALPEDL